MYGLEVLPNGDPYITTAEKAMAGVTAAGTPGPFLVDTLPIRASRSPFMLVSNQVLSMKYVLEWFSGAGFQKKARLWRKAIVEMNTAPFETVKRAVVSSFLFSLVVISRLSRILELRNLLSPRRYWKKFLYREMRFPGKKRSYGAPDLPSTLGDQTRHELRKFIPVGTN